MSYRVTVRDQRSGHSVQAETPIRDVDNDRDVEDAARAVMKAQNRVWPGSVRIRVDKAKGRYWEQIKELIL